MATAAISSPIDVQTFFDDYFTAWRGTDIDRILSYYAEDVTLVFAGTAMGGRAAVETNFVRLLSRASLEIAISRRT